MVQCNIKSQRHCNNEFVECSWCGSRPISQPFHGNTSQRHSKYGASQCECLTLVALLCYHCVCNQRSGTLHSFFSTNAGCSLDNPGKITSHASPSRSRPKFPILALIFPCITSVFPNIVLDIPRLLQRLFHTPATIDGTMGLLRR
jgi:hypothetical protein